MAGQTPIAAGKTCKRGASALALAILAGLPGQANAFGLERWAFVPSCTPAASQGMPGATTLAEARSAAILGGAPSKLDMLRAQQDGRAAPVQLALASGNYAPSTLGLCPVQSGDTRESNQAASVAAANVATSQSAPQPAPAFVTEPDDGKPNVFGSVALNVGHTPLDHRWQRVRASRVSAAHGPWAGLVRENRNRSRAAQIEAVNSWVNRQISFVDDSKAYGVADQWAGAAQSIQRGKGDCEDYAIAKMHILQAMGVRSDDMYLVIARDLVRHADHAVLVVRQDGRLVMLDNGTDRIIDARQASDYRPIMSYSGNRAWLHGYRTQPRQPTVPVQTAALYR